MRTGFKDIFKSLATLCLAALHSLNLLMLYFTLGRINSMTFFHALFELISYLLPKHLVNVNIR